MPFSCFYIVSSLSVHCFYTALVIFQYCLCTVSTLSHEMAMQYSHGACVLFAHRLSSGRIEPGTEKGLRDRNSPTCTLSQNGYGDSSIVALLHALCQTS